MVLPTELPFRDVVFIIARSPLNPLHLFLGIQYACVKKKFVRDNVKILSRHARGTKHVRAISRAQNEN
jgi:hypothetical protein